MKRWLESPFMEFVICILIVIVVYIFVWALVIIPACLCYIVFKYPLLSIACMFVIILCVMIYNRKKCVQKIKEKIKTITNFLKFKFSSEYRRQEWQKKLEHVQERIKAVEKEVATMHKTKKENPAVRLTTDLEWNYRLLGCLDKKEEELKKKLKNID